MTDRLRVGHCINCTIRSDLLCLFTGNDQREDVESVWTNLRGPVNARLPDQLSERSREESHDP